MIENTNNNNELRRRRRRIETQNEDIQEEQQLLQQMQHDIHPTSLSSPSSPLISSTSSSLPPQSVTTTSTSTSSPSKSPITVTVTALPPSSSSSPTHDRYNKHENQNLYIYSIDTKVGRILTYLTTKLPAKTKKTRSGSALPGFLALLLLTMANYMLSPMRDAAALAVGIKHIPLLTLISTILALASSVPMGWLFEAPNPLRKGKSWRDRIGLTRGETQGTSLALFLRCFAICLIGYALTFKVLEWFGYQEDGGGGETQGENGGNDDIMVNLAFFQFQNENLWNYIIRITSKLLQKFGKIFYVAFFLVVHLMKLHSLSLIWGVTSEAMEYEEQAEIRSMKMFQEEEKEVQHHQEESQQQQEERRQKDVQPQSRTRLKRLAFVGFGGTLGGILGSVFVSMTAHTLRLSGLLVVAATLLFLSAELSVELGQIMLRHWNEEQHLLMMQNNSDYEDNCPQSYSNNNAIMLDQQQNQQDLPMGETYSTSTSTNHNNGDSDCCIDAGVDSSMKRVSSFGGMKRSASGMSINSINSASNLANGGTMKRVGSVSGMKKSASGMSINSFNSMSNLANQGGNEIDTCMKKVSSVSSMKRVASGTSMTRAISSQISLNAMDNTRGGKATSCTQSISSSSSSLEKINSGKEMIVQFQVDDQQKEMISEDILCDDNSFKQRLLRGIFTILRSRLLMTIFAYNALYATTSTLLSFQRAELVANRSSATTNMDSDTAFLAKINIISSVAVFALQASGLGAFIASGLGQRGTLCLMPIVRMFGVAMLILWHVKADGIPPNLTFFLVLDELTKVINFAVAKPVRESLWRGLSNEARYEAKPIVDTLANRWGSGSAAFLMALLDRIMLYSGLGEVLADGTKTLFGFPPLLILCAIAAAWWAFVSADLGHIRHRIDLELKKQQ